MEEKHEGEKKVDEIMLPGFRFHPTDEELVGFYLKRKIQQRPLSIELIRQLDIYKYDPWDLPKLACTGEKEWYFYCPRDRKYRNSARPNRVTGAGFWKATGTDRPIYSSEGSKCIGLKKSLVFYKGRAAKGLKTDWMMHEFRLPSLSDHLIPSNNKCLDKSIIPASDSWAICRIFKKTNPVTPRTVSHSWVSPSLPNNTPFNKQPINSTFSPNNNIIKTNISIPPIQSNNNPINYNELDNIIIQSPNTFSYLDIPTFKTIHPLTKDQLLFPSIIPTLVDDDLPSSYFLPPLEDYSEPSKSSIDVSSMLFNMSSNVINDFDEHCEGNMTNFGWESNVDGQCHELPPRTLPLDHDLEEDNIYYQDCLDNLVNEDQSDYHNKCSLVSCLNDFPFYLTN